jgi:hypothetical protein
MTFSLPGGVSMLTALGFGTKARFISNNNFRELAAKVCAVGNIELALHVSACPAINGGQER